MIIEEEEVLTQEDMMKACKILMDYASKLNINDPDFKTAMKEISTISNKEYYEPRI